MILFMHIVEIIILLLFIAETYLAFTKLEQKQLKQQQNISTISLIFGGILMLIYIISAFSDSSALTGIILLLLTLVVTEFPVARAFSEKNKQNIAIWIIVRNVIYLVIFFYDFFLLK